MPTIFKLLEDLVVEFLQFLKLKSAVAWFIVKQCVVFSLLFTIFIIVNGMLFGYPPIYEVVWWEPFAHSLCPTPLPYALQVG